MLVLLLTVEIEASLWFEKRSSCAPSRTRGLSHTPRGVRGIITSILLTAWPRRPWTHSSYLSRSKVRGQIMHCRCTRPAGDGEQRGPGREPAAEGPDVLEREAKPQGQGGRPGRELQVASIGRRHRLARPPRGRVRCRRSNGTSHEPHQKTLSSWSPVPAKASRSVSGR